MRLKKSLIILTVVLSLIIGAQSVFAAYVDEQEPTNNFRGTGTAFTFGDYANGWISSSSDVDWWKFYADANQGGRPVDLVLTTPLGKDYQFSVTDEYGSRPDNFRWIIQQDGQFGASFTLRANTTYYIIVYGVGPNDHTGSSTSTSDKYYMTIG